LRSVVDKKLDLAGVGLLLGLYLDRRNPKETALIAQACCFIGCVGFGIAAYTRTLCFLSLSLSICLLSLRPTNS
jgi:hypothetical protein